jgi:glycine oxidase
MISLKPLARLLRHPILANIGGVSAKADGTIHVGGTVDLAGFNKQIRPNDTAQLLESASILIPRLREGPIDRVWTGLRPYCADGLPVIGPVPGWDNVMVAAGHYKLGITGSAITGKIITDLIVAGHSDLPIEPLSPARFG